MIPPSEPISETLKDLKLKLPSIKDGDLLANAKNLRIYWRRNNSRSNILQIYLYREEIKSRLSNLSLKRKIFYMRRFSNFIKEINKLKKIKKIDEDYLNDQIKKQIT